MLGSLPVEGQENGADKRAVDSGGSKCFRKYSHNTKQAFTAKTQHYKYPRGPNNWQAKTILTVYQIINNSKQKAVIRNDD